MLRYLVLFIIALPLQANKLQVPDGFQISYFATDIENARQMTLGDKGTVFVGSRAEGNVYALLDVNKDGKADKQYLIAEDLNMPSGVAFKEGDLYVAAVNTIYGYRDIEDNLNRPKEPEIVIDTLPDDEHHGWKAVEFNAEGKLLVPVGVPCNICMSNDKRHGAILELDINTGQYSKFASGVRNSVGLAVDPSDNSIWFTDNGRDWMGDDLPPDEINHAVKAGLDFGFPYLHGKNVLDPKYGKHAKRDSYTLPVVELGAHVAPLGLDFYTGKTFPAEYHSTLFVTEHGSWNRSEKSGYRVISIHKINDNLVVKPFITGWLDKEEDTAWGRPVDVLNLPDGSILVSDDFNDAIYRVSHQLRK